MTPIAAFYCLAGMLPRAAKTSSENVSNKTLVTFPD
jgi:hypothetical protein